MPLFGSKKTPEDKAREANTKMKQIVLQKVKGKITTEQAVQQFYNILKNDVPREVFADPGIRMMLQDKSGLDLEPNFWYTSIFHEATEKLVTGK